MNNFETCENCRKQKNCKYYRHLQEIRLLELGPLSEIIGPISAEIKPLYCKLFKAKKGLEFINMDTPKFPIPPEKFKPLNDNNGLTKDEMDFVIQLLDRRTIGSNKVFCDKFLDVYLQKSILLSMDKIICPEDEI